MTAQEHLVRLSDRNFQTLSQTVRAFPKDKLDWKPAPGSRSALDQLQEIATILEASGDMYKTYKLEFNPEDFGAWMERRQQYTDAEELLQMIEKVTASNNETIMGIPEEDLVKPFEMPWPGEFRVIDVLGYHPWNMAYHDAQINYIASMLETPGEE
ncbi:DinB family protein [bacterium]|nr:MAG: DinB family protein [bacterium]